MRDPARYENGQADPPRLAFKPSLKRRIASMRFRFVFTLALGGGTCSLFGCQQGANSPSPEPVLRPVKGNVTVQGKPLAHAVVTFLQTDEKGTTTVGETDEDGDYELSYIGKPGTAAASYKVAISYLMGTDGTVYGLAPRSGLSKPYGMITAKERLPPEWSDLGKTTHRAVVPDSGGTLDFDIKEPLLPPPVPETPAKGDGGGKPAEPAKAKGEPSPAKSLSKDGPRALSHPAPPVPPGSSGGSRWRSATLPPASMS
jgi:hypothetical protein